MNKNTPYYLIATVLFILLKLWYTIAGTSDLLFLLKPVNELVEFFTGWTSEYVPGVGFYFEKPNIIIERSCSGFNFLLICFMMLTFLSLSYLATTPGRLLALPLSICLAWLLTLFANSFRIIASIVLHGRLDFLGYGPGVIHESIGIVTYLSFLMLTYYAFEKLLIITRQYAKPA